MSDTDITASVIIAGAGPVGLALACELGQRGIDCLLIEKRDGVITVPKQSMVTSRVMEFCRRWGVATKVRNAVWPESHPRDFVYVDNMCGRELLRVKMPSYAEQRGGLAFTPEPPCPCPQIYFDPILLARVKTFPHIAIAYNTRLDSFIQDEQGVSVAVTDLASSGVRCLRTQFLVGCEGPAGIVRQGLGIALGGLGVMAHSLNLFFRSAELASVHDKGWARFYRLIDETGCWAELIPIDGRELWRLTVFDKPASQRPADHLLRRMAGGPFAYEMLSVDPWERRDFVAQSYGVGRVFIAGDAAHECSPTGGLGMHSGIEEAGNLGWKLAAVIEGWGGSALLNSYEAERRPIAARNVEFATRTYRAITGIPACRADCAEALAEWGRRPPRWLQVPDHLKIQYCYEASPICIDDGTPPSEPEPEHFMPSSRPGSRAPHAWLGDGRSTIDLFGNGFVLLRLGEDAPEANELIEAARSRRVPLRVTQIADPAIAELYARKLVLVRPDGHVAWRGDDVPPDAGAIVDHVRGARKA
jgi:2-polyprenyl-6-methoxyphenol hydroxylase-like FAD-dependent oxidoreductase